MEIDVRHMKGALLILLRHTSKIVSGDGGMVSGIYREVGE
jgi:hypothetical protein